MVVVRLIVCSAQTPSESQCCVVRIFEGVSNELMPKYQADIVGQKNLWFWELYWDSLGKDQGRRNGVQVGSAVDQGIDSYLYNNVARYMLTIS